MSSYFSNTEYHLESRRESINGLHNNIQQGNRSALATSVSFSLYNNEGFSQELNYTASDWDMALGMTNNMSNGIFDTNPSTGKSNAFDNKLVLGLSQAVSSRTFSEFDSNLANSLKDSRNSLKFLTGEAYRIDPTDTKAYASQTVFENIFGSVLKQKGMYLGSGNDPTKPQNYYADQSYNFSSVFDAPRMNDKQSIESRGQETLDRLVYSDLFGGGLVPVAGQNATQQEVNDYYDNRFNNRNRGAGNNISDLDFIRSKSMTNELVGGNVSRTTRTARNIDVAINNSYQQKAETILHDMKYQTRPGILPFVAMFEAANEFITIDTFQYQNKAISDVVVSKIIREVLGNNNLNFKVNMTVGTPMPGDDGVSAAIFGPNLLEVAKMQKVKDIIVSQLVATKGKTKEEADTIANNIFNIKLAGSAHHRKVYITDQVAVLGSINLTSPVGDSVFKAGSNFEFLGMFHANKDLIRERNQNISYKKTGIIDGETSNTAGPSKGAYLGYTYDPQRLNDSKNNNYKKAVSALMYEQVVAAQSEQIKTRSAQSNVKYATDIMYTLKATVDYLHTESGRPLKTNLEDITGKFTSDLRMTMVLDQAFLLHVNHLDINGLENKSLDNKLNMERGEMGAFAKDTYSDGAFRTKQDIRSDMYKAIQKNNFSLVAMGITKIVVDSKNFRSQVIEPTWDFLNARLGNTFVSDYGGSISGFVNSVTNSNQSLAQKVQSINTRLGINDSGSNSAYQILAIASGNMAGADVPRQHGKMFEARQNGKQLVSYSGSANMSMYNMGVGNNSRYLDMNGNDPFVTDEMGLVFMNRQMFINASNDKSGMYTSDFRDNIANLNLLNGNEYSLLAEEERAENRDLGRAVIMSYNQLNYGNRLDSGILKSIEGLPYWAKQSNTSDLLKLEASLKEMSKGLGDAISINRKYDRFGTPLMLEVSINPSGLMGLNTASSRLTYTLGMLQGNSNQPGPVFFQKEGKLIYNSNFTNTSGGEIDWKYGDTPGKLGNGQSAEMSSIANTTSIFATMIGELTYKQAISNPKSKLVGVTEGASRSLLFDYTASVLGINRYLLTNTTEGLFNDGSSYSDHLFQQKEQKRLANELESRFSTIGVNYLDNTRAFAGIDVFSNSRSELRQHIETIRNATSGDDINSGITSISALLGQQGYEDLALDVLRVNSGYRAENDINKQMVELSRTILDPYLQAHQVVSYGAGVAASKYINYGLDSRNQQAISMLGASERSNNPLLQTLSYARTFARDIDVYSTFGNDYNNNERFYIGGVAEGVSTQNKDGYQLELFGIRNKFPTDRNSLDILEATGIGSLVSKERLQARFGSDSNLIMDELFGPNKRDSKGILFNLDPNKPAQINQRIKNALGSRLMYEISSEASDILLKGGSLKGFRKAQQSKVNNMLSGLLDVLGDNDQAKKFISNYLSKEEVNLASMYDTDVRTVLNESAYNLVKDQRKELFDQFKDIELDEQNKIALNYLFRLKMVNYSSTANSIGSVIGGRRDKPQFMMLQLNGGYSDHFYLNPEFRTKYYASASTTTTTGIKASMLDARTFVGNITLDSKMAASDGFVINEGDMFIYDRSVNKVVQIRDGETVASRDSTYVGGTGSSDYLRGQIENFSFGGKPVASVKQRSTSNRPGEDSVQLILTAKRREGGSALTNEIILETSTLNMMQTGSGRRQEGTAASTLFKGIGAYLEGTQFKGMFDSFSKALGYSGEKSVAGVSSFNKMNVQLSDVYGLINPNNLKSGFFMGHGAALLTTVVNNNGVKEKMAKVLVDQDSKLLAAALVSQLGLDQDFSNGKSTILDSEAITRYKQGALAGEYGTYLGILEMQKTISGKSGKPAANIFGSIPQFIMNNKALVGAVNSALKGENNNLRELLGEYVTEVIGKDYDSEKGYLVNSSDLYTRGVTAMLTAIDMFGQLKNQKGDISIVTDWLLKTKVRQADGTYTGTQTNDPLVEIMAALGGSDNAFKMDRAEKDELANVMGIYLQQNYAVALALNILPSSSKDPLGKNLRAKTELQHLLSPLEAQTSQFKKGGNKNSLSFVLGTIFAASETGMISLGMSDSKAYLDSINSINALDPGTQSGFFGNRFLGVYYNANSNSSDLMRQYKKIYSTTVREGFDITKADMYLEDGSLTLAEAAYIDKKAPSSDKYTNRLRSLGQVIVEELKQQAIAYNLEESKGMGTDITQPKLRMLQEMGSTTYNILMPEIAGPQYQNEMTGDINTVFSNTQNRYIFMPGAELLNQVGSSFGDFVSEIVGKSINMYSYFTPGTVENDLMIKLSKAKQRQKGSAQFNINLSVEETKMLATLYNLGDELLQSIVEASSDTLMQKAVAGHGTEFDGYVSTPIPNMALNYNQMVMPQYVNEKYGAPDAIASIRQKLFDVTSMAHLTYTTFGDELNSRFQKYKSNEQVKAFTRTMGNVLDNQKQTLVRGMSSIASLEAKGGVDVINHVHGIINDLQKGKAGVDTDYIDLALAKAEKASNNINKELDNTGAYDRAYVASYVLANLQFAKIKVEAIGNKDTSIVGKINDWMSERGYQDAIYLGSNHEIRDFIHNSTEKNKYSMGLDLVNHYGRELEGAIRGKHTVYKQVNKSIRDLINGTAANEGFDAAVGVTTEFIDRRIENLRSFTDKFAPTSEKNAKTRQEHFLVRANKKSIDHMINDMTNIREQVIQYKDSGNTSTKFLHYALQELGYIHNSMSELDNMQNQSWRSAPFGSTESHLGTLMAVRGVDQFNKMMESITDDQNIVRFDKDRSKSLSMFSGLSFLTNNLGDFDGDNYITLMHKVTEKIESIDQRQMAIEIYKKKLSSSWANDKNAPTLGEEYRDLTATLKREEDKLQEDGLALKALQVDLNKSGNQGKMAKDVAAYMGIDSRFFRGRGSDEGGFRSQGTIAISSMAVMLEQGKGLYGGLQGVSSEINTRVNALLDKGPAAGLTFDKQSMDTFINSMNDSNEANKVFTALGMADFLNVGDPKTQEGMIRSLQDAMRMSWEQLGSNSNRIHNQMGEHTSQEFYQALVTKLHATTKASDALGKVMGAGLGIGMLESTYDVLTKTLGEAGSDVLGKTYNTLLGTFVADSPVVSLYHMLEGNSEQIAQQMNKAVGSAEDGYLTPGHNLGNKFMANIQAAYDKAQELQGWNKSIQQMLRDSIKLKGDSKSVMAELTTMSEQYEAAGKESNAEELRRKLVDDMASKIGPGAGMKGLMDLNKMIHNSSKGNDQGGLYGTASDFNLIGGERDIAETLTGYNKEKGGNEDALIKYKVSNSLRSISTMFNFEKNFGSLEIDGKGNLKIDDKASSNRALETVIADSLSGFLDNNAGTKHTTLLLAEHAIGSKEFASELTNKLYSSVEAINQKSVGLRTNSSGYSDGYLSEEHKNKAIVEQVNKFSAELISHKYSASGILGTMLQDHMGMNLNEDNIAKLKQVREGSSGLSTASLLVISHFGSLDQTKNFMGDYGSGLDRFVHINKAAQVMQSNISKGVAETGVSLLGSDLFNAAYRLMAQGKLSTQGGSVMNRLFKAANDPNMTNADAMGKMLSNFSGDEDSAKEMAEMYKHLKHVEITHDSSLPNVAGKKETVGDLINRQSTKTSQGFKLQAISEIAEALKNSGDMSAVTYDTIYAKVSSGSKSLSDDEQKAIVNELMSEQGLLLGSISQEGRDYFKPTIVHRGSSGQTTNQLKQGLANGGFNIVGPALLSMIGGAIYGTSKDEAGMDAAGVIGGTLSLMGFNMPHGKGASNLAGALFRSKAYNNPDEDWSVNMAKAASTELSMGLVGHYVTPKLTDIFNRNIVAPLMRNNLPIAESGVSAIIGSFVGAIAMNMLDSVIQQSAGLLKNNFNSGDNNLNAKLSQLQDNLSDVVAARGDAEIDPMSADRFIDITDKLDIPPLVIGVWATDGEIESLKSDSSEETYIRGGQEAYV